MSKFYLYLAGFIGCAAVIVFSGTKLAKYGEKIAELTINEGHKLLLKCLFK